MQGIWEIIKKSFKQGYYYLGIVLAGSLGWFALMALPIYFMLKINLHGNLLSALPQILAILASLFILVGPATAGNYIVAWDIVRQEDPDSKDLLAGFKQYFLSSGCLLLLDLFILVIFLCDLVFFYRMTFSHTGTSRYLFLFMLVITGYIWAVWSVGGIYHWPLLIEENGKILKVQKKSILLTLDNPIFTFIIAFVIILLSLLLWLSWIGAALIFMMLIALFQCNALFPLLQKYGVFEKEENTSESEEG